MRELLERWAKLEPERCQVGEYYAHFSLDGFQFRLWHNDVLTPRRSATLLAAVIEAIEARGWDWNLMSMLPWNATARRYMATVTYHVKEADSDVAALLTAYLAALEAEAKQ